MEALDLSTSIEHKWRRIQSRLRAELGDDVFTSWFGRVELEGYDGRVVQVSVPTKFLRNWLQSHYSDKLRSLDLLLIDDMEFLQNRTFQQEFCHTLNSLIDGGKQVVVAADCAPLS